MILKRKVVKNKTGWMVCFLFVLVTIANNSAFSQGGWFIEYLPAASVRDSLLGQEIRIDFKSPSAKGAVDHKNIRRVLSQSDTVRLMIDGQSVPFAERWRIHVDYGSLDEQYLESTMQYSGERLYIKEIFLEQITETKIALKVRLYKRKACDRCNFNGEQYQDMTIVINRSDINGILLKT